MILIPLFSDSGGEVKAGSVTLKLLLTQGTKLWYQGEKGVGGEGNWYFLYFRVKPKRGKKI